MASKTVTTPENKARVLELIGEGLSVREICRQDMPARKTVYQWIEKDKDFGNRYARACARRADDLFDALLEIANGDGDVNRDRLRVDALKWSLSKMQPKKFGDRYALDVDHSGRTTIHNITTEMTPQEASESYAHSLHLEQN